VYVTGSSIGTNYDYATIKYNSSGVQQWVIRYNGPGNSYDYASSLAVDGSGNVYVTGVSFGSGTYYDYATIKYSQTVGIIPISNQIPEAFRLYQNFPNPFNPTTKIRFDNPPSPLSERRDRGGFVQLIVYDILGREVAVLVNEQLNPRTYEAEWDGSNYPSGVYYYILTSGEFRETRKMVLIR
jgi:hypothetical protein